MKVINFCIFTMDIYIRIAIIVVKNILPAISFILIGLFTHSFQAAHAQQHNYYLIDDFDFSTIGIEDSLLLDSALTLYYKAKHDTVKLKAISILADNLYNGILWPKYNQLLYDLALEAEKKYSGKLEKRAIIKYQSTSINNFGYLEFNKGNIDKSLEYYELSNSKQKEIGYLLGYSHSLNNLGTIYFNIGKLDSALNKYNECIPIQKELKDYENLVQTLNNLAVVYREIGQVDVAAKHHEEALQYCTLLSDPTELAETYAYLGELYLRNGNLTQSKKYFTQGLEIQSKNNFTEGEAFAYSNLGKLFLEFDSLEQSKTFFLKADSIFNVINHQFGRAGININLGKIARQSGDFEAALNYYRKSLAIRKSMKDAIGEASCYYHIGELYYNLDQRDSAVYYCQYSLEISRELKDYHLIETNSLILYKIAKSRNQIGDALNYFELYTAAKDTLHAEENKESLYDLQYREEYITKTFNDSLNYLKKELSHKEKIAEQELELDKQYNQIFYLSLVGVILLGMVGIALYAYRKKIEANEIITEQKKLVEEKNFQITESINYAKRIQEALLNPSNDLSTFFRNYQLFFQPKDIVSGDFYWWKKQNNHLYMAVGDCTGHGVPGALMSALSLSFLQEIVVNESELLPHQILEELRVRIIQGLSQTGDDEGVKDGLDISLLRIDLKTLAVDWSGANNEVYILSKDEQLPDGFRLFPSEKICFWVGNPTDQHVGYNHKSWKFEHHNFQLTKGDWIFLFTDGYIDQFGGEAGKKLKHTRFKQSIIDAVMNEDDSLEKTFRSWKGNYDQMDDVCVLGVQL